MIRTQPLTAEIIAARRGCGSCRGTAWATIRSTCAALSARGIPLAIVGDANSRAVAEHAMALILAAAKDLRGDGRGGARRRLGRARRATRGRELGGARLLIVGYGRTGRLLARMAAGFEMRSRPSIPWLDDAAMAGEPARRATDLGAALAAADVVSVHAPKGDRPVLGADEIARLKPGAIVVNTARGGVVDDAALAAALREGRIAGGRARRLRRASRRRRTTR